MVGRPPKSSSAKIAALKKTKNHLVHDGIIPSASTHPLSPLVMENITNSSRSTHSQSKKTSTISQLQLKVTEFSSALADKDILVSQLQVEAAHSHATTTKLKAHIAQLESKIFNLSLEKEHLLSSIQSLQIQLDESLASERRMQYKLSKEAKLSFKASKHV
jgi:hypothetical protein